MTSHFVDANLNALKTAMAEPSQDFVGHDVRKFAGWLIGKGLNNCLPKALDPCRLPEGNTDAERVGSGVEHRHGYTLA